MVFSMILEQLSTKSRIKGVWHGLSRKSLPLNIDWELARVLVICQWLIVGPPGALTNYTNSGVFNISIASSSSSSTTTSTASIASSNTDISTPANPTPNSGMTRYASSHKLFEEELILGSDSASTTRLPTFAAVSGSVPHISSTSMFGASLVFILIVFGTALFV